MTNHMFDSRKAYVNSPLVMIFVSDRILFQKKKQKLTHNNNKKLNKEPLGKKKEKKKAN